MFLNGDAITISMEQAELIAITSLRIISIKQTYEGLPERKIRGHIHKILKKNRYNNSDNATYHNNIAKQEPNLWLPNMN